MDTASTHFRGEGGAGKQKICATIEWHGAIKIASLKDQAPKFNAICLSGTRGPAKPL